LPWNQKPDRFSESGAEQFHRRRPIAYILRSADLRRRNADQLGCGRDEGRPFRQEAVRKAMEKADFESVRGKFKFGTNHIPIQNFYLQEAIKDGDGYVLKTVATIVEDSQDRFHEQCPMK
jgi:branched-chain amino acid transport system substrate-binding protein